MAIANQKVTERYALYNGDSMEVLPLLGKDAVHFSIYSPPFATEEGGALYHYSSSDRDLSNARTYQEFFEHYAFFVSEIYRVTMPGRMTVVHCMDVPSDGASFGYYIDFPGDIIKMHEKIGFKQASPRITIWKEPLTVRNRTMTKSLAHKTIVEDSCDSAVAGSDYLLIFRKKGKNPVPVAHPQGLLRYAGERNPPADVLRYRGWKGSQIQNRYSHWIWRQYASSVWDDIRGNTGRKPKNGDAGEYGVLPYKEARDEEDEKHLHPLQLDVYDRALVLWSNPGETILEPFSGVGSGPYCAVRSGRRAIGIELKPSYYRQAIKNCDDAKLDMEESEQESMEFQEDPIEAANS